MHVKFYRLEVMLCCFFSSILYARASPLPPDVEIARFLGDRVGAYSLTFDDGLPTHVTNAVPILDKHGLKGTFFLFTDNIKEDTVSNWDAWKKIGATGHEIGSHSKTHLNMNQPLSRDILDDEIQGSLELIQEKTGVKPLSFAYPFSDVNDYVKRLVMQTYQFDRSDCRVWGGDDFEVEDGLKNIQSAIDNHSWEYVMLHGVGEYTWGALNAGMLDALCAYLVENDDKIWTDTYSRVASYIRKRNAARVIRRNVKEHSFEFRLRLPDRPAFQEILDVPLTVRIPLDGRRFDRIRGFIEGDALDIRMSTNGQFLLADVRTDGSWVRIVW